MTKSYCLKILILLSAFILIFAAVEIGAEQTAGNLSDSVSLELFEEQGLENTTRISKAIDENRNSESTVVLDSLPDRDVLLIPNCGFYGSVEIYDPQNGSHIGIFIPDNPLFAPICAAEGPDGNIYVVDGAGDSVTVFNRQGVCMGAYADRTDELTNIRGVDFRHDTLFVTSADGYVAQFRGFHDRLPGDFINDGSDPYDIYFLDDGRALLADMGATGNVRLYNADGTLNTVLFNVSQPRQIQKDLLPPGDYLVCGWNANQVIDFDLTGAIHQTTYQRYVRGVYRLGTGNLLVSSNDGLFILEPGTGTILDTVSASTGMQFIELVRFTSQSEFGAIGGIVTDALSTNPIAGVIVAAQGTTVEDTTDVDGEYYLVGLEVGTYDVDFSGAGYFDTTVTDVAVTANDTTDLDVEMTAISCFQYLPGDVNMYNGVWPPAPVVGADATYLINFFSGSAASHSCFMNNPSAPVLWPNGQPGTYFWASADANGDCQVIGADVTKLINYLRGSGTLSWCVEYEPCWHNAGEVPVFPPSNWPGCPGHNSARVSGTVTWPGHTLSGYTYAFADTFDGAFLYMVSQTGVDSSTGNYTLTISQLAMTLTLYIEAQDDVNNNDPWWPDAGDGWGYYNPDGDPYWDPISVSPGDNIAGIDIEMSAYIALAKSKMQFIRHGE